MIHEGERLDREIKRLERELEQPISDDRRRNINSSLKELSRKKSAWERPH